VEGYNPKLMCNASPTARVVYLANIKKAFENETILTKEMSFQLDFNKSKHAVEELLGALLALETLGLVKQTPYKYKGKYWWLSKFEVINEAKLGEFKEKMKKKGR
jgi:hypothetical protein